VPPISSRSRRVSRYSQQVRRAGSCDSRVEHTVNIHPSTPSRPPLSISFSLFFRWRSRLLDRWIGGLLQGNSSRIHERTDRSKRKDSVSVINAMACVESRPFRNASADYLTAENTGNFFSHFREKSSRGELKRHTWTRVNVSNRFGRDGFFEIWNIKSFKYIYIYIYICYEYFILYAHRSHN